MKTLVNSPILSPNLKDIIPRVTTNKVERQIRKSETVMDQKRCERLSERLLSLPLKRKQRVLTD
jgi:hypothetical protein